MVYSNALVKNQKIGFFRSVPTCPNSAQYFYRVGKSALPGTKTYDNYWHVTHEQRDAHKVVGLESYYPYYRSHRGMCYTEMEN